jgi:predicted Abi (CAAX) family protease
MTIFSIAFKIWLRTVVINAVMMAFAFAPGLLFGGLFASITALGVGFFLTFPLLALMTPLVKLSVKIPYSSTARIFWLWFYLELMIVLFYIFFFSLLDLLHNFREEAFYVFASATSVALSLAMFWSKKSLRTIITDKQ